MNRNSGRKFSFVIVALLLATPAAGNGRVAVHDGSPEGKREAGGRAVVEAENELFCVNPRAAVCRSRRADVVPAIDDENVQTVLREAIGPAFAQMVQADFPLAPVAAIEKLFRGFQVRMGPANAGQRAACAGGNAGAFQNGPTIFFCRKHPSGARWKEYTLMHEAGHLLAYALSSVAPDILKAYRARAERALTAPAQPSDAPIGLPAGLAGGDCPSCHASKTQRPAPGDGNVNEKEADYFAANFLPYYLPRLTHAPLRPSDLLAFRHRCGTRRDGIHPVGNDVIDKYLGASVHVRRAIGCDQ